MKTLSPSFILHSLLAAFATLAVVRLPAADLSPIVREAALYESGRSAQPLRQLERLLKDSAPNTEQRRGLEAALIQLLSPSSTFEARRFACQQLALYGTETSLPALAKLLAESDTAGMACLALSTHASPGANTILRDALATTPNRAQVIVSLGERRDPQAVPQLASLARDPDPTIASAAISALGKIASDTALAELARLRGQPDATRSRSAALATLVAADRAAREGRPSPAATAYQDLLQDSRPLKIRRAALEGLLRIDPDGGAARILQALRGPDAGLKPSAIAQIPAVTSPDASEQFARALPGLAPAEQVLMIEALAARNDSAARQAIIAQVSSPSPDTRCAAVTALADIGDAAALPVLLQALNSAAGPEEQQLAARALVHLEGGDTVDRRLAEALNSPEEARRVLLIQILGQRGRPSSVPVLLKHAASPSAPEAQAAFRALAEMAPVDSLPDLVNCLAKLQAPAARDAAVTAATRTLSQVPDPARRSQPILTALAQSDDPDTRCSLVALLPACGDLASLQAAQTARTAPSPAVRQAALRALADWPDLGAWSPLVEAYQGSESKVESTLALRALVRLAGEANTRPTSALVGRYRTLLQAARDDTERKLILGALAGCGHPGALELVRPLQASPALHAEAELAAGQVTEAIKNNPAAGIEVGVATYTFRHLTAFEAIEKTRDCGGEVIEFHLWQKLSPDHPNLLNAMLPDPLIRQLKTKLDSTGVWAVNAYFDNSILADRAKAETGLRQLFEFARKLGLRGLTGEPPVELLDLVEQMVKEYNIQLCFHNHPKDPARPDYRNWDPAYLRSLMENRDPRMGFSVDTGHLARSGVDPVAAVRLLGSRVHSVHLKDVKEARPDSPDVPYGRGIANIAGVLAELKRQGFQGHLAVEHEELSDQLLEEVKHCIDFARAQLGSQTRPPD